eukprot:gnl/Dysnectes_brevis/1144_a1278_2358.p1 GENE.gnl/Dysnectes_brevis/1144_a1278_2358~~gnl/Dysnectes_brevis/1144_a1278_2358.p1  ORF type:complete len:236 (+),score=52.40 gnl/Dysnectes_brevis/1144_a1278_2358:547-1254(+)
MADKLKRFQPWFSSNQLSLMDHLSPLDIPEEQQQIQASGVGSAGNEHSSPLQDEFPSLPSEYNAIWLLINSILHTIIFLLAMCTFISCAFIDYSAVESSTIKVLVIAAFTISVVALPYVFFALVSGCWKRNPSCTTINQSNPAISSLKGCTKAWSGMGILSWGFLFISWLCCLIYSQSWQLSTSFTICVRVWIWVPLVLVGCALGWGCMGVLTGAFMGAESGPSGGTAFTLGPAH